LPIKAKRTVYITAELHGGAQSKSTFNAIERVVQKLGGKVIEAPCLFDILSVKATFPHRRYKALQKAIASALVGEPVVGVTVASHDPFTVRRKRKSAA
jgi:hypothetical protein